MTEAPAPRVNLSQGRAHRQQLCAVSSARSRSARRIDRGGPSRARQSRAWPPGEKPPQPGVPIRRSVQRDYVVCLECGFRAQALRGHLRVQHGLEVAAYRIRWNLPSDHPVTAPAYSVRRSAIAKQIGLGHRRAPVEPPAAPRRRRRP
jgi:predicted transcriptional regulator